MSQPDPRESISDDVHFHIVLHHAAVDRSQMPRSVPTETGVISTGIKYNTPPAKGAITDECGALWLIFRD